jgi:hypothetical protein
MRHEGGRPERASNHPSHVKGRRGLRGGSTTREAAPGAHAARRWAGARAPRLRGGSTTREAAPGLRRTSQKSFHLGTPSAFTRRNNFIRLVQTWGERTQHAHARACEGVSADRHRKQNPISPRCKGGREGLGRTEHAANNARRHTQQAREDHRAIRQKRPGTAVVGGRRAQGSFRPSTPPRGDGRGRLMPGA